jgi:hypothetical protein
MADACALCSHSLICATLRFDWQHAGYLCPHCINWKSWWSLFHQQAGPGLTVYVQAGRDAPARPAAACAAIFLSVTCRGRCNAANSCGHCGGPRNAASSELPVVPWLKKAVVVPNCNYTFVYYNSTNIKKNTYAVMIIYLFITIAQRLRIRNIYKRWNKDYKYNTDQV